MLDTLRYSKRLQELGLNEAQAKAHAQALHDAVTESLSNDGGRFDTLKYALHLETAGIRHEQAVEFARALWDVLTEYGAAQHKARMEALWNG